MSSKMIAEINKLGIPYDQSKTIVPGDLYLACRNTGVHLLTCKSVDKRGFIVPVENAYFYDTNECVFVIQE